ncbi:putative actin-related protein RO7 [Aspergillus aculeatinus CBS 121060]|uniref:Actin-like ATPase domain-containing protein n=1 Tax=Aspergillus aculeatinus CBS 121060 TaxID=1448322 RepID=A0ACD1HHH4_9EURO|nr:actin-like ATPase domain-containing protein [Aspergillus aculeatinus CBS 121060]RAH72867.1 actin-like ATPase domain-containing protein [Aspergillus aculeatinus CBS 121060]
MASTSFTNSAYDDNKRPFSMSSLRGTPSSPHTPQHHLRSNNSSFASTTSSTSFRGEEDAIIFELGARWLRAGFEGESAPMCVVGCGPEECRRVGDYRGWLKTNNPDTDPAQSRPLVNPEDWASAYELWKMDLRGADLGLVEDKIERVFRETYNKYLLTDAGTSRLVLVLPAIMPHPLLSAMLSTLFSRWRFPSITLLTSATMAATAAGVRSALVVDIGWAETVVTGVYEYREIAIKRSTRAMKALLQETGRMLTCIPTARRGVVSQSAPGDSGISVRFEFCEEVASRFLWCRPRESSSSADLQQQQQEPQPNDSETEPTTQHPPLSSLSQRTVEIPSPSNPGSTYINLPFSTLSEPVESVLFAAGTADCELDDEEKPLPLLIYNALLTLPPDARGTCMSRIIFTGGGANIPGIRQRILADVAALVAEHGWSPVRGKVIEQRRKLANLRISPSSQVQASPQNPAPPLTTDPSEEHHPVPSNDTPTETKSPEPSTHQPEPKPDSATETPKQQQQQQQQKIPEDPPKTSDEEDLEDPIEQKIRRNNRDRDRDALPPSIQGVLREVESLGPWAGASLTTSLKIRGLVEIEREKYLQHGLAGATRDYETQGHHIPDRRSGLRAGGGGDRSSWTLAGWG